MPMKPQDMCDILPLNTVTVAEKRPKPRTLKALIHTTPTTVPSNYLSRTGINTQHVVGTRANTAPP